MLTSLIVWLLIALQHLVYACAPIMGYVLCALVFYYMGRRRRGRRGFL